MAKRESYGPHRSPFKIFLYIVIIVLLLGGIAYLVKCTRVKQAAFQEQIRELGAQETEFVQKKQTVQEESETETKKSTEKATAQTEKKETSTEAETEKAAEGTSESETESETGSENVKNSTAIQKQHILLLNGSGKDGMAARWQARSCMYLHWIMWIRVLLKQQRWMEPPDCSASGKSNGRRSSRPRCIFWLSRPSTASSVSH